jgi:hypothetical protein
VEWVGGGGGGMWYYMGECGGQRPRTSARDRAGHEFGMAREVDEPKGRIERQD